VLFCLKNRQIEVEPTVFRFCIFCASLSGDNCREVRRGKALKVGARKTHYVKLTVFRGFLAVWSGETDEKPVLVTVI